MIKRGHAYTLLVLVMAVMSSPLRADHPITREQAVQRALIQVNRLIGAGKLDESWRGNAQLESATVRANGAAKEWEVTFTNPRITVKEQRRLFVFLTETGIYLAANFSGE